MPEIANAYRQVVEVLQAIECAASARVPFDRQSHGLAALASVSRCRSLLIGITELDKVGRADLVGVLLRALLDVWHFGVIALLGDESDLDKLEEDHLHWKKKLASAMPGLIEEPGEHATFSVHQRAKRAGELLSEIGESEDSALEWYRTIYAAESLVNAHAGFESLKPYILEDADGRIGIVHEPESDERLRYGRLRIAAVLTALLAKWTWDRTGLRGSAFDEIEGLGDPS